jgi:hypothetical protein
MSDAIMRDKILECYRRAQDARRFLLIQRALLLRRQISSKWSDGGYRLRANRSASGRLLRNEERLRRLVQRLAGQPHCHPTRPYTSSSVIPISTSKPKLCIRPTTLALALLGRRSVRCSQRGRRLRPLPLHLEQHLARSWIIRPFR